MVSLSVVIPTYNEERDISSCIKSLNEQSFRDIEIIVVDDGSTDNTIKVASSFKKVKILRQYHQGPGKARNLGAKIAKGDILIFIDADMTFHKDYLKNLIKPLSENKDIIGTTHDNEIVANTDNIWSKCWGRIRVSPEEAKNIKIFRAIRRKDFLKLGGFNSKYGYADDQTLWFEHKVKPIVAGNTICYHRNPETLKSVYKQSRWIGASIDSNLFNLPIIKLIIPLILFLLFPLAIPILSLLKCYKIKNISIIIHMLIFMTARYFGTLSGISRKIYFDINYR